MPGPLLGNQRCHDNHFVPDFLRGRPQRNPHDEVDMTQSNWIHHVVERPQRFDHRTMSRDATSVFDHLAVSFQRQGDCNFHFYAFRANIYPHNEQKQSHNISSNSTTSGHLLTCCLTVSGRLKSLPQKPQQKFLAPECTT